MAMISTAFLPDVVHSLAGMLADGTSTALGVTDELAKLKEKLEKVAELVADAEAKEVGDAVVRAWLGELRGAMYELGDAVDDYLSFAAALEQPPRRSIRHLFGLSSHLNRDEYKPLKNSIKSLNVKMDDMLKKNSALKLSSSSWQNQI